MGALTQMSVYTPILPIRTLEEFLNETESLFDNITGPWAQLLSEQSDRQNLLDAWTDLKNDLLVIKSEVTSADPQKLKDAGLNGKQLTSKLGWISRAWERFHKSGTVKLLRKLLQWINVLLGSIAKLIFKGEAIKELKEAIEKLIRPSEK